VHPKPPKVGLHTNLRGPAYTGERLPIIIGMENGEDEIVTLEIQYGIPDPDQEGGIVLTFITNKAHGTVSWKRDADSTVEEILTIGKILPGAKHECTLLFNAPLEPTDFTLNVVVKYTLESDTRTEIRKTLSIDIPIIQPFHTSFDILPCLGRESDMPDPFSEETLPLPVSQRWLLTTSITRLGSEKLELQHIGVTGTFNLEEMSVELYEGDGCSPANDQAFGIFQ
jgi:Gryzun, putative trafficking through Golgi